MQQLRYADELRSFGEVPVGPAEVKEPEIKLAIQLIEQIATDTFQSRGVRGQAAPAGAGADRAQGARRELVAPPVEEPKAQVIDLMAALQGEPRRHRPGSGRGSGLARRPQTGPQVSTHRRPLRSRRGSGQEKKLKEVRAFAVH